MSAVKSIARHLSIHTARIIVFSLIYYIHILPNEGGQKLDVQFYEYPFNLN